VIVIVSEESRGEHVRGHVRGHMARDEGSCDGVEGSK
jgi:hypothetical protein